MSTQVQKRYELYRTLKTSTTEAVDEATWAAAVGDGLKCVGMDQIFAQPFFAASGETIVFEPHWYNEEDSLLTIGAPVSFTSLATSSDERSIEDGEVAAAVFPAPYDYFINPGAHFLRVKATTLPAGNVGLFIGSRP